MSAALWPDAWLVREDGRDSRQLLGRELVGLRPGRDDDDARLAVLDLVGDLRARERGMDRHVHAAGHENGQIGDEPIVADLAAVHDALARLRECDDVYTPQ